MQAQLSGGYAPWPSIERNPELRHALDLIDSGLFSHGDRHLFAPLTGNLRSHDPFLVCADYQGYMDCQDQVGLHYHDPDHWARMSILNVARIGRFSSDRAVREYAEQIWHVHAVPVAG